MTDANGLPHHHGQPPIVVGVDGSRSAKDALEWAAAEATVMRRSLHLVHAFAWPTIGSSFGPFGPDSTHDSLLGAAERVLVEAERRASSAAPTIKVTTQLIVASAVPALLRQAEDAELIVLGSRGLGGFSGLLIGSVGIALAAHAACPVVVVRRGRDAGRSARSAGPVVVGIDGPVSSAALRFAFHAASRRDATVVAVRCWPMPSRAYHYSPAAIDEIEEKELADMVERERRNFPDVRVHYRVVRGHPGHALVVESSDAGLVVVGSRGRGGFAGMVLGSVSQAVLQHANCPVAVVRGRTTTAAPDDRIEAW